MNLLSLTVINPTLPDWTKSRAEKSRRAAHTFKQGCVVFVRGYRVAPWIFTLTFSRDNPGYLPVQKWRILRSRHFSSIELTLSSFQGIYLAGHPGVGSWTAHRSRSLR